MQFSNTLLFALMVGIILCATASAAARRQGSAWSYFHFDGHNFVTGQSTDGKPFLAVRENALPVVVTQTGTVESKQLPKDKGILVGICYTPTHGGKLAGSGGGYAPNPGMPLTIVSGDTIVLQTHTDGSGYFLAVLDPGHYRVTSGAFSTNATIESGTTVLVPLRAGKRMVD